MLSWAVMKNLRYFLCCRILIKKNYHAFTSLQKKSLTILDLHHQQTPIAEHEHTLRSRMAAITNVLFVQFHLPGAKAEACSQSLYSVNSKNLLSTDTKK